MTTRVLYTGRPGMVSTEIAAAGFGVDCIRMLANPPLPGAFEAMRRWVAEDLAEGFASDSPDAAWVAITSATSVPLLQGLDQSRIRIAAGGPATAEAARAAGWDVALVAPQPSGAASLAKAFADVPAARVLLPVSELAGNTLEEGLRKHGHTVFRVDLYTTAPDEMSIALVKQCWFRWDAYVLTSASTVDILAQSVNPRLWQKVVALGEPTSEALTRLEVDHVVCPETTPAAVLNTIRGVLSVQNDQIAPDALSA